MDYKRPVHIHNNYMFSPSVHRIAAIDKSLIEDKLLIQKLELVREREKEKKKISVTVKTTEKKHLQPNQTKD